MVIGILVLVALVLVISLLRFYVLRPILGAKGIEIFDMIVFTIVAAYDFANGNNGLGFMMLGFAGSAFYNFWALSKKKVQK